MSSSDCRISPTNINTGHRHEVRKQLSANKMRLGDGAALASAPRQCDGRPKPLLRSDNNRPIEYTNQVSSLNDSQVQRSIAMINPVNIDDKIKGINAIKNRGPHTSEAEVEAAFATLGTGDFRDCALFLGSFDGSAGWERHMKGDELVQILAGSACFDFITNDVKHTLQLSPGMLMVVPQGCWHRFRSQDGVTVLTATPRKDEQHTHVDDPRVL